ncbi:YoaK family protein [Oceanospirillum beijerinckii]|uniref:YoaK family protein n=1 Tax=Oceanospirillum beijerinckii TaxID=64976 RepID=UPI00041CF958|nr:YoaK family protein [Oceanospirillum beijerinckii]
MISRLPRWIEYGAFLLALMAGTINAVGLLGFQHQSISHLSGTVTLLGSDILHLSPETLSTTLHLAGVVVSFMLGAMVSGFMMPHVSLKLGRHYDALLIIEGLLLLGAIFLLEQGSLSGHYLASAACGLQNAMVTRYSGAVIRTTHMTGIVTDLGIMLGAALRNKPIDRRKLILLSLLLLDFTAGGIVGTWLYQNYQFMTLSVPAVICFILALYYRLYRIRFARRIALKRQKGSTSGENK